MLIGLKATTNPMFDLSKLISFTDLEIKRSCERMATQSHTHACKHRKIEHMQAKEMPIFTLIIMYSLRIVLMKAASEQRDVMA